MVHRAGIHLLCWRTSNRHEEYTLQHYFERVDIMKRQRNPIGRVLQFERLETRSLLSVTAGVNAVTGDLDINGDGASDSIQVSQTGPNTWKIQGSSGTKINGSNSFVTNGVTGSIFIDLDGGNNKVNVTKGTIPSNLLISDGTGNDN